MRVRRMIATAAGLTGLVLGGVLVEATPAAAAAIRVGPDCATGYVCIYDGLNATGGGWALPAPWADSNLGLSPDIVNFNDHMESWKNNSGRQYCWYTVDIYRGSQFPMPSYGNGRIVNLRPEERNTASSIAPC